MEIKEQSFDTGVARLNYAEGPAKGSSLVLLHGGNARWQFFWDIMPNLGAKQPLFRCGKHLAKIRRIIPGLLTIFTRPTLIFSGFAR